MAFNPFGFVLGSLQAQREGVNDPQARTRLGFIGGLFGSPVTGLALTTVLARREAEAVSATVPDSTPVSSRVSVPNVANLDFDTAKEILEVPEVGLKVERVGVVDLKKPKDQVIEQDPEADTLVAVGSTVTLFVSLGFPLPNVVEPKRLSIEEATKELQTTLGLKVVTEGRPDNKIDKDLVISQTPEAGTFVSAGDEVTLIVSQGPVEMPNFNGRGFQDARDELQELGLNLKVERIQAEKSDDNKAPDEVVGQDPPAGSPVAPGSRVKLTVNPVELPKLKGQKFRKARETLQNLNLRVRRQEMEDSAAKGEVVDQNPEPGPIAPESLVTLFVSTGRSSDNPK
jgi:beta-lactam-binding protein with PASTA domain